MCKLNKTVPYSATQGESIRAANLCLVSETKDHEGDVLQDLQVQSFEPVNQIQLVKTLEKYRDSIEGEKNYTANQLDFVKQEALTVFKKAKQIKGFCTAWHRSTYPLQAARILNRFWFDQSIRRTRHTNYLMRTPIFFAIEHQCIILKNKGFKWAFISRPFGSERWCHKITKALNKYSRFKNWNTFQDLFLVCPYPSNISCWQILVFVALDENEKTSKFKLLNNRLSKGEFIEKFKKKK